MTTTAPDKVPVTILTGFLGSGKTTLLNRVLSEHHGKRIAVIENEFGEVGVDQALVINADEEVFEMNNGCICCTVRGDLIRILGNLMRRRDKFDHILVETTGMADPSPVAQTFFVDDEMRDKFRLDGIVTLVDARHVLLHLDESDECKEQIAFADVLVLNKTDLVTPAELAALEQRVRTINAMARIHHARNADVPVAAVLDVGGFDLARAMEQKPTFLETERPFEWGGLYAAKEGRLELTLSDGPDPSMSLLMLPVGDAGALSDELVERASRRFSEPATTVAPGGEIVAREALWQLDLRAAGPHRFALRIPADGTYALFTQHLPAEFALEVRDGAGAVSPLAAREFAATHEHDNSVTSVGIEMDGAVNEEKLNRWMSTLLREQGTDIFRMKGILHVAGNDNRFVFQGVHMLLDAREDRAWGPGPRTNLLVFIGRRLDREALNAGFRSCLA